MIQDPHRSATTASLLVVRRTPDGRRASLEVQARDKPLANDVFVSIAKPRPEGARATWVAGLPVNAAGS